VPGRRARDQLPFLFIMRRLIAEPRELHNDMRVYGHVRDINVLGYKYLFDLNFMQKGRLKGRRKLRMHFQRK